jgi:glycosyltransferase involved in cell wall biosynthesis
MKILYLSEMLGPHDYRFLKTNIERGYDVVLLAYRDSLEQAGLEAKFYDVRNLKGLKIIHRPLLAKNTPLNFLKRRSDIRSIICEEKPDVVHAGWIQTSGLLAALSGFHPYLLMPWGSDIIHFSKDCARNMIATRIAVKNADMITVDCEYEKTILVDDFKYPADRVIVMPWDTDLLVFNSSNKDPELKKKLGLEGKKVMLMMRIFRPEYGIEDFIKALPKVKAENPDARALMLGYGPIESELKKLAQDLGVDDYIVWTGYVPQREVVKYINISDIYVSTSLRDGSSSSLLESMACGLATVVSDIPGNMEWIEDSINGIVVKRSNPSSIASGLNRLLKDDGLRKAMSASNINKIKDKADFSKNVKRLDWMYKTLADSRKA